MKRNLKHGILCATIPILVAGCSSSDDRDPEIFNTDYSALRLATSRDVGLKYATSDEQVLHALRNGLRMSLAGAPEVAAMPGLTSPPADNTGAYSNTTVQVEGVDEADLVKYDGTHLFIVRPQAVPPGLTLPAPGLTRSMLKIVRTNAAIAQTQIVSEFQIPGEHNDVPVVYQVQSQHGTAEYLAAVSQHYRDWSIAPSAASAMMVQPDRTTVQVLDVRDPVNPSQSWSIELDGWLRASRKIGDTLYLVKSYRPQLSGFTLPAETEELKLMNERRIRRTGSRDLLPLYRENGGAGRQLLRASDCVLPADLATNESYSDLVVITALDVRERRITDVNCVSTNVNGVYVSEDTLYIGGEGAIDMSGNPTFTVLHKFALTDGNIRYRASGTVGGRVGWLRASYFMDEHDDLLRIVTTQYTLAGHPLHRLSVLEEAANGKLETTALLPSPEHPQPIGKPGEEVHAVRFFENRAYVVTALVNDPLYVIDLTDKHEPFIAGELEMPGFSTYLQPLSDTGDLLLSVGRETTASGIPAGVKVELLDVSDMDTPRSLDVYVFGKLGTQSDAVHDAHALTFLPLPADDSYRIALPIDVFDTPHPMEAGRFLWSHSGSHLFEVRGVESNAPRLLPHGLVKTAESSSATPVPPFELPNRNVLHGESIFTVVGDSVIGSRWSSVPQL